MTESLDLELDGINTEQRLLERRKAASERERLKQEVEDMVTYTSVKEVSFVWSSRPNLPTKKPLPATASATSYPPSAKNWCLWWEKNLSPSPSTRQKQRAACTSPIRVRRTSALLLKPCVVLEILFHSTNINTQ